MMVAGLSTVTSGGIVLAGKELNGPGPDRGVVFQSPSLLPWMTAFQNVMLGVDQVFYTAEARERRTHRRILPYARWTWRFDAQASGRAFPRHAAARWNCARVLARSEDAACSTSLSACLIPLRAMNFKKC